MPERVLVAKVQCSASPPILAIVIHVDTTGKEFDTAKEAFGCILDEIAPLLRASHDVIVGGDFNLTVHWSKKDVPVRDRLATEFGMINCTGFIEDTSRLFKGEVSTLEADLSDHHPIMAELETRAIATTT